MHDLDAGLSHFCQKLGGVWRRGYASIVVCVWDNIKDCDEPPLFLHACRKVLLHWR